MHGEDGVVILRQARDAHPGNQGAVQPIVALDLVIQGAGGRPATSGAVVGSENNVVTVGAGHLAAVANGPKVFVRQVHSNREIRERADAATDFIRVDGYLPARSKGSVC